MLHAGYGLFNSDWVGLDLSDEQNVEWLNQRQKNDLI